MSANSIIRISVCSRIQAVARTRGESVLRIQKRIVMIHDCRPQNDYTAKEIDGDYVGCRNRFAYLC